MPWPASMSKLPRSPPHSQQPGLRWFTHRTVTLRQSFSRLCWRAWTRLSSRPRALAPESAEAGSARDDVQDYRHNRLNHRRYNNVEYLTDHYPDRNHRQTPYCGFRYHVGSLFEIVRNPP